MSRPLQNHDLERNILGCVLMDNRCLKVVRSMLEPDDFDSTVNRSVYRAMLSLERDIDHATLHEELKKSGNLKQAGLVYLAGLTDNVATVVHIEQYCRIIAELSTIRKIRTVGTNIINMADTGTELRELKGTSQALLRQAIINEKGSSIAVRAVECVDGMTDEALSLEPVRGVIRTRLGEFDSKFGGYHPGIYYVLAGRPSMGKSTFAINVLVEACLQGKRCILFTFEENCKIAIWRMLSKISQVPIVRLFNRRLSDDDRRNILEASHLIKKVFDLTVIDRPMSSQRICDITEQLNDTKKVDFAVIDLIPKVQEVGNMGLREKTTCVSNKLSTLPTLIDAPVLALHQLNRGPEGRDDKMPTESDLRESGAIEEDAKGLHFVMRPYKYDKTKDEHQMLFRIAKNSNGPTGDLELWCDLPRMTIRAVAKEGY